MIMDVTMWCLIFMVVVTAAVPRGRCACIKQATKNLVNECANPALNNCDGNAMCTDLPDGFSCSCNAGFTGDGTTCTELCDGVPCDEGENRTCYLGQSCLCTPGFHVLGDACIESCDVDFDNTVIVYPGSIFTCTDFLATLQAANLNACIAICTFGQCAAALYDATNNDCIIYNCDPSDDGATFTVTGDVDLFFTIVRNCQ